jgi:hypothetical protein
VSTYSVAAYSDKPLDMAGLDADVIAEAQRLATVVPSPPCRHVASLVSRPPRCEPAADRTLAVIQAQNQLLNVGECRQWLARLLYSAAVLPASARCTTGPS